MNVIPENQTMSRMRPLQNTFLLLALLAVPAVAQSDQTADYINSLFFHNRLAVVRTSYDRWQSLTSTYYPDKHPWELNSHFYSAMNDFNYGKDKDGHSVSPMMLGYAFGFPVFGFYFLGYTTDFGNFFRKPSKESPGYFKAATVGANVDLTYATLQGDATFSNNTVTFFTKTYVPSVKTFIGLGLSTYRLSTPLAAAEAPAGSGRTTAASTPRQIVRGGAYATDMIQAGTSIVRYFNVGFRYLRLVQARYVPNISTAWHQFRNVEEWEHMTYDAELFFESRNQTLSKTLSPKDYEARVVVYYMFDETLVSEKVGKKGVVGRPAAFLGLSYKSEENGFTGSIPTQSGKVYTGQDGIGWEIGVGLRVLGLKQFGFQEDSYVKLSYFRNYSQYFERYPGLRSGIKFRVLL